MALGRSVHAFSQTGGRPLSHGGRAWRRRWRDRDDRNIGDIYRFRARLHSLYSVARTAGTNCCTCERALPAADAQLLRRRALQPGLWTVSILGIGKRTEPWRRPRPDRRYSQWYRARRRGGRRPYAAYRDRQRAGLCVRVLARRRGDRRRLRIPGDGALMGGFWLTAVVFTPLVGALFVLAQPEERATWRAGFIFSLLPLAISFYLFAAFDPARANYQFVEQ